MKRITGITLTMLILCSVLSPITPFTASAARERELPTMPESILSYENYVVSKNVTINAGAGGSGLIVSGNVTITIKKGVKLSVKGGNANGTTGAGAGIEVPEGSSLTITGEGTLEVVGGNAAAGDAGDKGGDGAVYDDEDPDEHPNKGQDWCYSGAGGNGGNGGGGAGAGIGGKGGNGGLGGNGGAGLSKKANTDADSSGNAGGSGKPGTVGTGCGKVTICKTLNYTITAGSVPDTLSNGGDKGKKDSYEWHFTYIGFGGGGGGGGGNGYPAADIGSGGSGGDGGGGGGSGIIIHWYYTSDINSCEGTGCGGVGGNGYLGKGNNGASATTSNNDNKTPGAGGGSEKNIYAGSGVKTQVNYYELTADVPQAKTGLVYDGSEKTGVEACNGCKITDGNTATNAGSYKATAKLLQGYCWPGGSHDDKKISWSIAKKPIDPPLPVSLCYSGFEQIAYTEQPLYTVENVTGTAVGDSYKAKFTLKDKINHRWDTNDEDNGITYVSFVIHEYIDENKDGACDKCNGTVRYYYNTVSYLDKSIDGDNKIITEEKTCDIARGITKYDTEWGVEGKTAWLVVDESVDLEYRPVVKGDVRIILANGKTLTANQGITVEDNNSVKFYAQSDDKDTAGTLNISATGQTAIGGHTGKAGNKGVRAYNYTGGQGENGGGGGNAGKIYFYGGNYKLESIGKDGIGTVCIGGGTGGNGGIGNEKAELTGNAGNGGHGGAGGNANDVYFYGGNFLLKSDTVCFGGGNAGNGGNGGNGEIYEEWSWSFTNYGIGGNGGNGGNASDVYFYGGIVTIESGNACISGGNGGNGGNGTINKGNSVGRAGNAGNGGSGGKTMLYGGNTIFESKNATVFGTGIGGAGGTGSNGIGQDGAVGSLDDDPFTVFGLALVKAGENAQNAEVTTKYNGDGYISVQFYHSWEWLDVKTHRCVDCGMVIAHADDGNGVCLLCGKPCAVLIPEVAPTCGETGHIAYYKYDGKYYIDNDCTKEITDLEKWLKKDGFLARLPHSYSDEWSCNEDFHWHATTCGHNSLYLRKDKAAHILDENGICTVCSFNYGLPEEDGDSNFAASVFSKANLPITVSICAVIIAALGGVIALIILKKKKKN